jgi:hypothetical protein
MGNLQHSNKLKNRSIIQQSLAFVMLLLFTFSITPKRYLHDLIANHEDFYSFHSGGETTVTKTSINCQCEDLVVSTPFVEASFELSLSSLVYHKEFASSSYHSYFLNTCSTKDSRGPPAVG